MAINKLSYGINRVIDELSNKEDYWHLRLKPMIGNLADNRIYFHNMLNKGHYPGEFINEIPVIYLDGKTPVYFYITVFNYALGLLNRYYLGENVSDEIITILDWTLKNQKKDGAWRYDMPNETHPLASNKASGMTQGLGVSFIIRAYRSGFLEKEICLKHAKKAVEIMCSNEIVSNYATHKLIEEFYNPGTGILNGSIFGLYGLYDYCTEINNFDIFNEYISDMKEMLKEYKFYSWSYYDRKGMIASRFYHQLHIDMMRVLYELTKDSIFLEYSNYWEKGKRIAVLFIVLKSFQKLVNIKTITINNFKNIY